MQVIRLERSLQDERQQLRGVRDEAAAAAQKHQDAIRQMNNRLAVAVDAAAASESRAQACEREAAARSLEDESIMRGEPHRCTACAARDIFPVYRRSQLDGGANACAHGQVGGGAAAARAAASSAAR